MRAVDNKLVGQAHALSDSERDLRVIFGIPIYSRILHIYKIINSLIQLLNFVVVRYVLWTSVFLFACQTDDEFARASGRH